MNPFTVNIFLISGRCGVGKSTMAYEVCHQLSIPSLDVPHIHIEGDGLDFIHPPDSKQKPNMMLLNLNSIFHNYFKYRTRSCKTVLISGTSMILQWKEIKRVIEEACRDIDNEGRGAGTNVNINGVVLHASDETVESRLRQREIGTDLERHLESSRRMAKVLDEQFGAGVQASIPVVWYDTESDSVSNVAGRIVDQIMGSRGKAESDSCYR